MKFPERPQVVVRPRCPKCGSANTVARRSQAIAGGLEHQGRQCAAQRQWRGCRACGGSFPVVKIGGELPPKPRHRWTGPGISPG